MAATRRGRWTSRLAFLVVVLLAACRQGSGATPTRLPPTATLLPPPATSTDVPSPVPTAIPATATLAAPPTATVQATAPAEPSPAPDPALQAILAYLEARARADVAEVTGLACAAWKPQAVTEAISFRSMNAKLDGVSCAVTGTDGPYTLVVCNGKIVTTYGTESRDWDLSTFVYRAADEDGQWKMCGYQ